MRVTNTASTPKMVGVVNRTIVLAPGESVAFVDIHDSSRDVAVGESYEGIAFLEGRDPTEKELDEAFQVMAELLNPRQNRE